MALLAGGTPETLSKQVRTAILRGPALLSVIAYWEVMIKSMKGTLAVGDPRLWFGRTLESLALQPLLFRPEHVTALHSLPACHQDPFDRAFIAQALAEDLTLLTTDAMIPRYASAGVRVIG